ncbi:unnamed protein product [Paramecium octaurelia]|uniref:Uncharacterized protein n=1 Tax=Paramecium octaurelia TaxID=43137 RepID=A0A8S1YML1_PAROT|nr:unnamed protein product [Paramecium octaurelia]
MLCWKSYSNHYICLYFIKLKQERLLVLLKQKTLALFAQLFIINV